MSKFWRSLTGLFGRMFGDKVWMVKRLVEAAYPLVKRFTEATVIESDDALLELAVSYGHPEVIEPGRRRNDILRDLAIAVLRDTTGIKARTRWFEHAISAALMRLEVEEENN